MTYLVAILIPAVGMLIAGKPLQALLCLILQVTLIGWIPAAIWSCMVVSSNQADKRTERIIRETRATR